MNITKIDRIFFDQYLFIAITLLSVMGLFFLYSASQGNINVVIKQAIFVGFGIFLNTLTPETAAEQLGNSCRKELSALVGIV